VDAASIPRTLSGADMDVLPIDLTAIVATIMGISIVLVPVIGLTARFALKPLVESMGHFFQSRNVEESVRILERRMQMMEQHLETIETTVMRMSEASEFHRDLRSGAAPGHAAIGSAPVHATQIPPGDSRP
jgi:hypothetical protein